MLKNTATNREFYHMALLAVVWSKDILLSFVRAILLRLPIVNTFPDIIIIIIIISLVLLSLKYILKTVNIKDILFIVIIAIIFLIDLLVYPENTDLQKYIIKFMFSVLPIFFVGLSMGTNKEIRMLYYISLLSIILKIIYTMTFEKGMLSEATQSGGDMDNAYKLLPHICLVCFYAFNERKPISIFISIFSAIFLILLGNRGSMICLMTFILLYVLFMPGTKKNKIVISLILIISATFVLTSINRILLYINNVAFELGLSTRFFNMLMEGNLLSSKGRAAIAEKLFTAIFEKPLLGYGVCGDQYIAGTYAHNIGIELWVQYGLIIGTLLFTALIVILVNGIKTAITKEHKAFILVLCCSSFMKLLFSSTYLSEGFLFLLIGFAIRVQRVYMERNANMVCEVK